MGNTLTLRDYLIESRSNSEESSSSEDMTLPEGGGGGQEDHGKSGVNGTAGSTAAELHNDGGRLWEVTPINVDDDEALQQQQQQPVFKIRGLANHDHLLNQSISDETNGSSGSSVPTIAARNNGEIGNNGAKLFVASGGDQVYVDNRLPGLLEDMPTIYEDGDTSSAGGGGLHGIVGKKKNDNGDNSSSTLEPKGPTEEASMSSSSSSSMICAIDPRTLWCIFLSCFFLFFALLGAFLFVTLRDDDDDNGSRGILIPDPSLTTSTPTASGGRLPIPTPTIIPVSTPTATDDALVTAPTSFPTFSARLWGAAGNAIELQGGGSGDIPPALAMSFDGRILVTMQDGILRTYQWGSLAWRPRGEAIISIGATAAAAAVQRSPGVALNLDGNVLAWGDPTTRTVHVLEWNALEDEWQERPIVAVDDDIPVVMNDATSSFYSLAISALGNVLAVGDPDAQESAGRAHLFQWDGTNQLWIRIRMWDGSRGSRFGYSIALSSNGQTMAVGAVENALATIVPGMVRIYRQQGVDSWSQIGQTIVGFRDQDRSGSAVSLSGNGQTVVIGSPLYDSKEGGAISKANVGQARFFEWNDQVGLWAPGENLNGTVSEQGLGQVLSLSSGGDMVAVAGTRGGLQIHRLNESKAWVPWPLSGTSAPSLVSNAVLAGSGKVVAVADRTSGAVFVYQAVSW